ncbi:hypothetical protein Pedsa_0293 [Pseudopedobacter saltans DSM 12145]|uniref:DUF2007 domain-containing protein n=1 Tax=Pseudopedobacter saltans (strain ATCC 51119 / DSM 12145 / JCM 21818 / CCUG 39354 / LMG 10337 / NBRC 100064 / NCIMB 13643) TaxID=762903 RepID=F0S4C1_PSESL|nr:DUF2007 domain-containing protein [Pseudopedobacter saltans]ADY50878.1 hypothetical protein Pedsa_0293 [Pseudopedobacter saltans DSM 12145]
MELITVKVFDNSIEAHILKSRLESEGIDCFIFDDHMVSLNPLYNVTLGGIKLKVGGSDVERANTIIEQVDNVKSLDDNGKIIKCPNCDSTDLYTGYKSMRGTKGVLSAIVSFLFMVFPIYYKTVYKCKTCGEEFKRE